MPFKQFTRNARRLNAANSTKHSSNTAAQMPRSVRIADYERVTAGGTITHEGTTVTSPQDSMGQTQNINVNINFNVTGNINIVNKVTRPWSVKRSGGGDGSDEGTHVKSSLRRTASNANRNTLLANDRRTAQHGSVEFDARFLKKASPAHEDGADDGQQLERPKRGATRPMSAAVSSSNRLARRRNFLSPKDADASSNMNSLSQMNQVADYHYRGAREESRLRHSSASKLEREQSNPTLLQASSRKQFDVLKKAEETFDSKNMQTVPLKNYFEQNLMITQSLDELDGEDGEQEDEILRSTQKSLLKQAKLFQQIYYNNKHINAYAAPVDMELADKEPTLSKELVFALFDAKFTDLKLQETQD